MHTLGPWGFVYDGFSAWSIGESDDPQWNSIAIVHRRGGLETWEEAADNARLIAAAPDLLHALKCLHETGLVRELNTRENRGALDAIAKAEGREK